MASNILTPSGPVSKANNIIESLVVEDLIYQVEDLEMRPREYSRVFKALLPTVNEVAHACQHPAMLEDVINQQRLRATAAGPTCGRAFDLFIENMKAAN